ncbi:ACR3 family arsenite efflux transporter, partial [Luteimicrobium sp. DT211]
MSEVATTAWRDAGRRLSTLDRWLPAWIGLAMIGGLLVGRFIPGISDVLASMEVGGISVPIAL